MILKNNDMCIEIKVNDKTFGAKISLDDLKPWNERKDLQEEGLSKHFEKRVKEGYIPFVNPNYQKGLSIEYALDTFAKKMIQFFIKNKIKVRRERR